MFVRFRQTARRPRLQVSLIETRRVGGRVEHEHVASLGSVASNPSLVDRAKFWTEVDLRLARLTNRVDAAEHADIRSKVAKRVEPVSEDEQKQVAAITGLSPAEQLHCIRVSELFDAIGDDAMTEFVGVIQRENLERERCLIRRLHKTVRVSTSVANVEGPRVRGSRF